LDTDILVAIVIIVAIVAMVATVYTGAGGASFIIDSVSAICIIGGLRV
jgi:hypothetical protein